MDFVVDQLAFLGLNEREVRVFTTLCTFGRSNMTTLAARSGLPRTTVDAIVRRMVKQGIVHQVLVKGHHEYEVVLDELTRQLGTLQQKLSTKQASKNNTLEINDEKNVVKVSRIVTQDEVRAKFLKHHGERATLCISEDADQERRMSSLLTLITLTREANLRCEILLTTDLAHALLPARSDIKEALKGFDVRLTLLPATFSLPNTDLCSFCDEVILLRRGHAEHSVIHDLDAVDAIDRLLFIARESGWAMDARTWLHIRD
jgi:predicted transcriptional regulator